MRSPLSTLPPGLLSRLDWQRSPPRLLTPAACSGLGSAPDCRTRRALLHLSYSCASPFGPATLVTHDPQRSSARISCRSGKAGCSPYQNTRLSRYYDYFPALTRETACPKRCQTINLICRAHWRFRRVGDSCWTKFRYRRKLERDPQSGYRFSETVMLK